MNDDIISPKIQSNPAPSELDAAPNDTEEQDTVSDRVFDFSDGDIKAVKDIDGPVTHSVNLEIAEALRNPAATIKKAAPLGAQTASQTQPITPTKPNQQSPSAWKPLSSAPKSPINKLEEVPKVPTPAAPAPIPAPKPISHPPIDLSQQAPAVKVYSQIPHAPTQAPAPIQAQVPQQLQKTPIPASSVVNKVPVPQVQKTAPSSTAAPKPLDKNQAALEEILKKVHSRTQAAPPSIKENLLDRNIGTLDASPFGTSTAPVQKFPSTPVPPPAPAPIKQFVPTPSATPAPISTPTKPIQPASTGGIQLTPSKPAPIPLQDFSQSLNKARSTPSNPATKVINVGEMGQPSSPSASSETKNLQDAIRAALPGNTRDQNDIPGKSNQFSEMLKPLRTYEGDVADIMSHKRTSTASIAIAETKKVEGEERIADQEPEQNSHIVLKITMALLILALLGGGVFGGYYLYKKSPLAQSVSSPTKQPTQQTRPGIIHADTYAVIPVSDELPTTILARIKTEANKTQNPGTIKEIILGKKNTSGAANTFTQLSASDALASLDIRSPDILNRTLTPDWMLGIYSDQAGDKSAFVIVTTNFFQNAFAGMLSWESVMADDLKQYLSTQVSGIANAPSMPTIPAPIMNSTSSTATSTKVASTTPVVPVEPLKQYFTLRGTFQDRIVKNKDVRAFRTDDGSILFAYSFIDNTHLAIAGSEAALTEILTRLEKQASIR